LRQARLLDLLSPEARIVLLTAGGESNDAPLRALLGGPLHWDDLLTLLEWERALPVGWWRLKALGANLSSEGADALERLSRVCEFRAMTLEDRLLRLLHGLANEGIPVILLKGSALALSVYPRFMERPMGDLDLLVAPRHSRRAWEVALAQGWVWDEHVYPQSHYQAHHHLPPLFDGARTGARLELHTALSLSSHPFSLTFEAAQAVSVPLAKVNGEGRARVLDPEHTLIHLAVHFAWGHLASFGIWRLGRDLAALARHGIDWGRMRQLADRFRAGYSLYWSLRLADELCGVAPAPEGYVEKLAPARSQWVLRLLDRHLAVHVIGRITPCPSEKLRRFMWSLALEPGRTATSAQRPWDSEPARRPAVYAGELGLAQRVRSQLAHTREWRRYLSAMRAAG
jgi:hypothetical protein